MTKPQILKNMFRIKIFQILLVELGELAQKGPLNILLIICKRQN